MRESNTVDEPVGMIYQTDYFNGVQAIKELAKKFNCKTLTGGSPH